MDLARIQPVVLAGGRSSRFGRDKLRAEVAPGVWLVDRPIGALRAVFGRRVALVGDCAPEVSARADMRWPDDHPGAGPVGGVLTALERSGGDVFVLAGDLPAITEGAVRAVLAAADEHPSALVACARTPRGVEPCVALYRASMAALLRARLAGSPALLSLHDAAPAERVALAGVPEGAVRNVNRPEDLASGGARL